MPNHKMELNLKIGSVRCIETYFMNLVVVTAASCTAFAKSMLTAFGRSLSRTPGILFMACGAARIRHNGEEVQGFLQTAEISERIFEIFGNPTLLK